MRHCGNLLIQRDCFRFTRTRRHASIRVRDGVLRPGQGLRHFRAVSQRCRSLVAGFFSALTMAYQPAATLRREMALPTHACTHTRAHVRECVSQRRSVALSFYLIEKKEKETATRLRQRCDGTKITSQPSLNHLKSLEKVGFAHG